MLESEGLDVSLRMTEEEYAELMRRRRRGETTSSVAALRGAPPSPEGEGFGGRLGTSSVIANGAATFPMGEGLKKRQKYGNRRVEIDGMKFDSQKEANFYFGELLPLWKAGVLKLLARQVPFDLPGGIRYIADFVTVNIDGDTRVIDAKSEITRKNRTYINKKKQMRACWGIEIQEV